MAQITYSEHKVWDRLIRWFHWTNLLLMLGLAAIGTVILNAKALGLSNEGKVLLKTIHVLIGYAFVTNLLIRLYWAFAGGPNARWSSLIPSLRDIKAAFVEQLPNLFNARGHHWQGHSPLGKISITLMLLSMCLMATTGLVLAGTDIYFPPLGAWVAQSIAAPGVDPSTLVPYRPELVDKEAYEAMRAWRSPFIQVHEFTYFALLYLVPIHVVGVVIAEVRGGGGLISAMFTGRKFVRSTKESEHHSS